VQFAARGLGQPQLDAPHKIDGRIRELGFRPWAVVDAQGCREPLGDPILVRCIGKVVARREHAGAQIFWRKQDSDRFDLPDRIGQLLWPLHLDCRFRILDSSVPVVQSAKDRIRNNVSKPLDWACVGRVLGERNVSSPFVIIGRIPCENSSKVLSVEHNQMIRALAAHRSDQPFNISILPGRTE
jgi:hypothetical protein